LYRNEITKTKLSNTDMNTRITSLLSIKFPIIQAGMVWCSGWSLASAVCNAGGLGLIGAGSMDSDLLKEHIKKTRLRTEKPFGVNIPLIYSRAEELIKVAIDEKVHVVFTSAGNPALFTKFLKENGIKVVHVVSNLKFALKARDAGVDAIVAEGVEAGGHNGKEETTTLTLIPLIRKNISVPLIAAGGIATGRAMLAAMILGADGVQIGSRFVASIESSAHPNFKQMVVDAGDGDTMLIMRNRNPIRILKNDFSKILETAENRNASTEEIQAIIGKNRTRLGIFEGNASEGLMEIGQVASVIDNIQPAGEIVRTIVYEYEEALNKIKIV
jgi:enoyl-[acyl-carrier protein] reductase II